MAVNESRDLITELEIGATEGTFKSMWPNRGGEMSEDTDLASSTLIDSVNGFGMANLPLASRPLPTGRWRKHTSGNRG
jgi:hypothetical protein